MHKCAMCGDVFELSDMTLLKFPSGLNDVLLCNECYRQYEKEANAKD